MYLYFIYFILNNIYSGVPTYVPLFQVSLKLYSVIPHNPQEVKYFSLWSKYYRMKFKNKKKVQM